MSDERTRDTPGLSPAGRRGPGDAGRAQPVAGFTLIEIIAAVGITALLAAFIVGVVTNISGFWARNSGRLSAESQARFVLDQLSVDLQGALYRDDGNTWLAATIPANTNNTLGLWNNTGTTGNTIKPSNNAGSLQGTATGNLSDARFGIAGTWLRFFTTKRGSNVVNNASTTASAPVAVSYQIVRRAAGTAPTNTDRRYLFHRVEVTPGNTMAAGFDITAAAYAPTSASPAPAFGTAREIRIPSLSSVVAENVIDFGLRMYVYAPNAEGVVELQQIFPTTNSDLSHDAVLPPGAANAAGDYTDCFPDVVDVVVRVLTSDGARTLGKYETGALAAPAGRTTQQYWWDLAIANSRVFTRRIVLKGKAL